MKKFFGILLYIIGSLFILALFGQLEKFLSAFIALIKMFTIGFDGYQLSYVLGLVSYWITHIAVIYFSFKYGRKLLKKNPTKVKHNEAS